MSDWPDYAVDQIMKTLRQPAQWPWRHEVTNDSGVVVNWVTATSTDPWAKYFARGMRGTKLAIRLRVKNEGATAHTITIKFGYAWNRFVETVTTTIPAGYDDWLTVPYSDMPYRAWNYDSMIVQVYADSTDVKFATDATEPHDSYQSISGIWIFFAARLFIRIWMDTTIGDLPVSGTVNIVDMLLSSAERDFSAVIVPSDSWTSAVTVKGVGKLIQAEVSFNTTTAPTATIQYAMQLLTEKGSVMTITNRQLTQSATATSGRCSIGEFEQIGDTTMYVRVPITFKESLEMQLYQNTGGDVTCLGGLAVALLE